ncbi:hypothetical protein TH606_05620 [Thermodesulfatator autotrophicus]|uniref:Glycosyl transferase family 1 domain-containing protein n=2 Tax=Thermodesulfatator autotrophicus TaxID=1795632 RepID=A0A177E708_9BACT|nr:hypothetical protein TH606_05620 [Thermodesulfatator autotrophicus]
MIFPEKLPLKKARSISYLNTCVALSRLMNITLFIPKESLNKKELEKFYGVDLNNVNIKYIPANIWKIRSNKIFNHFLKKHIAYFDFFYVRHLKIAKFLVNNKAPNQKVIFEAHEIFFKALEEESPDKLKKISQLKKLESYVYSKVNGIVFINKTLQKQFHKTFKNLSSFQKIIYLSNSFKCPYQKKDFSIIEKFYYCGNLFKWKGIEDLILTMKSFPTINLVIIGGSYSRIVELSNFAKKQGIKNIKFLGYRPPYEIKKVLLKESKIAFLTNSRSVYNFFTFPLKLLDYMITSNVVIAADIPAVKEIIIDGKNGFLFKTGDISSLVEVIKKVINMSPEKLLEISQNAYATAKNFTYENRAKNIYNFLKTILENDNQ